MVQDLYRVDPLIVSSLGKQDLILRFMWPKSHNSKINWQQEKMLMIYWSIYHFNYQDVQKADRLRVRAFNIYYSGFFSILIEDSENNGSLTPNPVKLCKETSNHLYIIRILSNSKALNICAITTTFQHFSLTFRQYCYKNCSATSIICLELQLSILQERLWHPFRLLSVGSCYWTGI